MPNYPKNVILMNAGAFSPLHWGHIEFLDKAAELCKKLGINVVGKIISPNNQSYIKTKHGPKAMSREERMRYIEHARKLRPDIQLDTYALDNDEGQHISRSQVIKQLRQKYPGVEPVLVGGEDTMGGNGLYQDYQGVWNISLPRVDGQSSTSVRNRKRLGQPPLPFEIDPDVPEHPAPENIMQYAPVPATASLKVKLVKEAGKVSFKITPQEWVKIGQKAGWMPQKGMGYTPQRAYGGVVIDNGGKVLLVEPLNHFDNTAWTFPKGKADQGESPEACAMREVREETGVPCSVISSLPGEYPGSTSITSYFLMKCNDGEDHGEHDKETASIRWATPQEAVKLLNMTGKASARQRDLAVLSAAVAAMPKGQSTQPKKPLQDLNPITPSTEAPPVPEI